MYKKRFNERSGGVYKVFNQRNGIKFSSFGDMSDVIDDNDIINFIKQADDSWTYTGILSNKGKKTKISGNVSEEWFNVLNKKYKKRVCKIVNDIALNHGHKRNYDIHGLTN